MALEGCLKDFIKYMTKTQRAALLSLLIIQLATLRSRISSLLTLSLQETILATFAGNTLDLLQGALDIFNNLANKIPFSEFKNCPGVVGLGEVFQDTLKTAQRGVDKASIVAQEATGRQPASQMKGNLLELVDDLQEQLIYIISLGD